MKNLLAIWTQEESDVTGKRFFFWFMLPFFFLLLIISYYQHFHGYNNRDTASYIEIAFKYKKGEFYNAINGYWSPLYSWLLTPLLITDIDPDLLLASINALSCILILHQLYKIAGFLKLSTHLTIISLLSFALALAQFSFVNITPDLLNLFFVVVYLRLYLTKQIFQKPVLTGFIGALMYFSKYYTFGFFLAHICLVYFIEIFILKKKLSKPFLQTLIVFLLISSLWIICLSIKYNYFLISYSGSYNHSITKTGEIYHSWEFNGLVPPAKNQLFPWEDIKQVYSYKDWNPLESKAAFNTQVSIIKNNFIYLIKFLNAGTRYGFYINLSILLLIIIRKPSLKLLVEDTNIKLMLMGFVFVSGYLLILLCNDRYIWLLYLLSALSISIFFQTILKEQKKIWLSIFSIIFLAYCFNKKQFDGLKKYFKKDWDSLPQNISLFKKIIKPGDKVASTEAITAAHFPIDTRCLYYGTTLGYGNDTLKMVQDLKKYKINYIISTDTASQKPPPFFSSFSKINEPFKEIKLFKIESYIIDSLYQDFNEKRIKAEINTFKPAH